MQKPIIAGLLVMAALGVGGYVYMNSKKSPASDERLISKELDHPLEAESPQQNPSNQGHSEVSEAEQTKIKPELEHEDAKKGLEAASGHFEISIPVNERLESGQNYKFAELTDRGREKQIWKILRSKDAATRDAASISSVQCHGKVCSLKAKAKGSDNRAFQSAMADLARQHPWLGNKIDVTTPIDDPTQGKFVYFLEIAK